MDEFQIISRFFEHSYKDKSVQFGIGDDGAILSPDPNRHLVSVMDTLIEGVHYPSSLSPKDIGYRAVEINLSDLAAMGARPRWMSLALTIKEADESWLANFSEGLFMSADQYSMPLVGGDTTNGKIDVISIHLIGDINPDAAMTRCGAKEDDFIFISGYPGEAAAGLYIFENDSSSPDYTYLKRRFCRPSARIELGERLSSIATAAIDISDGLYSDAQKMLKASGLGGCINIDKIPISASLKNCFDEKYIKRFVFSGGDDYELLFSANPNKKPLIDKIAKELCIPITCIGKVLSCDNLTCEENGKTVNIDDFGYIHFKNTQFM